MDPAAALADLVDVSSQVEAAVLFSIDGTTIASTVADEGRAAAFATAARRLFDAAEEGERGGPGARPLTQLEAATLDGSVFVVRQDDRLIAATTGPEPTVGLVFYDLKTCLRQAAELPAAGEPAPPAAEEAEPKPKPRRTRKKADAAS